MKDKNSKLKADYRFRYKCENCDQYFLEHPHNDWDYDTDGVSIWFKAEGTKNKIHLCRPTNDDEIEYGLCHLIGIIKTNGS